MNKWTSIPVIAAILLFTSCSADSLGSLSSGTASSKEQSLAVVGINSPTNGQSVSNHFQVSGNYYKNGGLATLRVEASSGALTFVQQAVIGTAAMGQFTVIFDLAPGEYTLTAYAVDKNGQTGKSGSVMIKTGDTGTNAASSSAVIASSAASSHGASSAPGSSVGASSVTPSSAAASSVEASSVSPASSVALSSSSALSSAALSSITPSSAATSSATPSSAAESSATLSSAAVSSLAASSSAAASSIALASSIAASSETPSSAAASSTPLPSSAAASSGSASSATTNNVVHYYSHLGWSAVNIHYNRGSGWTTAPGDAMQSEGGNWWKKEISKTASIECVFNYNNSVWDNNGSANYIFTAKEVWISNGQIMSNVGPQPPSVWSVPGSANTTNAQLLVTLRVSGSNVQAAKYSIDGSDPSVSGISFSDGVSVNLDFASVGATKKLILYAVNGAGSVSVTNNYERVEAVVVTNSFDRLRIYQVMVESFQNGDNSRGYGWGKGPSSHLGDIRGIINSLDYIDQLGYNAIWLTPVFECTSGDNQPSGYFAYNYFAVDQDFGSDADLREMISNAHAKGIYVLFDGVFGHHQGSVANSPGGRNPGGSPVSYSGNQAVDFYKEVATYWINNYGIDGWRLDVANEVPVWAWKQIREAVESASDTRRQNGELWGTLGYMVGEIWSSEQVISNQGYGTPTAPGLYSYFDFPLRYRFTWALACQENYNENGGVYYGKKQDALDSGFATHSVYPTNAHPNLMFGNHDLVRFGDLIQRAPNLGYGKENPDYWKRFKCAFSLQAAYTGPITTLYNDEIGAELSGYVSKDQWAGSGVYDDNCSRINGKISGFDGSEADLTNYVTRLWTMRDAHPALWGGQRTHLSGSAATDVYADLKTAGAEKIVYVLNLGTASTDYAVSQATVGGSSLRDLLDGSVISSASGSYSVPMGGLTARFLIVQ